MRKTVLLACVVLAAVLLGACAKYKFGNLLPLESVVVQVQMQDGVCRFQQVALNDVRTAGARRVTWFIVGQCPGYRLRIDPSFRKGDETFQLLDGSQSTMSVELPGGGSFNVLSATLKSADQIQKGHYRYTMHLEATSPQENSSMSAQDESEDGSFFACPVWPCGGFKDH